MAVRGGNAAYAARLSGGALTISFGVGEVIAWDRAGRLFSVWRHGRTFRRGLSGRAVEKWNDGHGRERRALVPDEIDERVSHAATRAREVTADLERHPADNEALAAAVRHAAAFDAAAARADARHFGRVYGEVGMLPPDQYLSLVVHLTEGCSFADCTFCDLYQRPFRVRSTREFERHLLDVRAYMGDSLALRRRAVFLGAANALMLPLSRLLPAFDAVRAAFGPRPINGFVDAGTGTRKPAEDYRALHERGLNRVYIGLESGHDPLLAFVKKPGTRAEATATVRALKTAGVGVGVIVMTGLGGHTFDEEHVRDTIATLNDMRLGPGDLIYFSELVEATSAAYAQQARAAGIVPLSGPELKAQRHAIAASLLFPDGRPKNAIYDIREFIY